MAENPNLCTLLRHLLSHKWLTAVTVVSCTDLQHWGSLLY